VYKKTFSLLDQPYFNVPGTLHGRNFSSHGPPVRTGTPASPLTTVGASSTKKNRAHAGTELPSRRFFARFGVFVGGIALFTLYGDPGLRDRIRTVPFDTRDEQTDVEKLANSGFRTYFYTA